MAANYRLIAVQVGDALKYATSINEINRIAGAIFPFRCENFPNNSITSSRAQLVHDWILSLARQRMGEDERNRLLKSFCDQLSGEGDLRVAVHLILLAADVPLEEENKNTNEFLQRGFHSEVIKHCQVLFLQGNYFHAVFEACKVYNKLVGEKALSSKDGEPLMMEVWGWQNGVLKVTACQTETDKNVQDGIKFLSAGLMRAMRNPTAHEPAMHWQIYQGRLFRYAQLRVLPASATRQSSVL